MKQHVRSFAICAVAVGMLIAIGYGQNEGERKIEPAKSAPEKEAAAKLEKSGVSKEQIQQAQKAFQPRAPSKAPDNGAAGRFTPKSNGRKTDLTGSRKTKPHNWDAIASKGLHPATTTTEPGKTESPKEPVSDSKSKIGEQHSGRHGHHPHTHQPSDACATATLPDDECKKARKAFAPRQSKSKAGQKNRTQSNTPEKTYPSGTVK